MLDVQRLREVDGCLTSEGRDVSNVTDAAMLLDRPLSLFGNDGPISVVDLSRKEANRLLIEWDHDLGPCDRPFAQDQWGLVVLGRVVSLVVTASTVSPTVTDEQGMVWPRNNLAELARICTDPSKRWATRPMLRLWREVLGPLWAGWPVRMAVSYASPGKAGHIYRHDGWTFVRKCKPASPGKGSTWAKGSVTDDIGDGCKSLWVYRYEEAT